MLVQYKKRSIVHICKGHKHKTEKILINLMYMGRLVKTHVMFKLSLVIILY